MSKALIRIMTIWPRLPKLAWQVRIAAHPLVLPLLNGGYAAFLGVRRLWRRPAHTFHTALRADLRTDHAGETGAVMIYRGILALSRDPGVREFAQLHLATESRHLTLIEGVLPAAHRSRLLPIWRIAGWLTGGLPSLAGPTAVYATIVAVETFVDRHYDEQIERIDAHEDAAHNSELRALRDLLEECRRDEVNHRDEARAALQRPVGLLLRAWAAIVGSGSAAAVHVSRLI